MDSADRLMMDSLPPCQVPDLREISLAELAELADDGAEVIHEVVARMMDDGESPGFVSATTFNSAI